MRTIAGVDSPGVQLRPDGLLVTAVLAGDSGAFDELYRAHVGAVRAVARSHVRDGDTVSDIVQDTFARALQHLDNLRDTDRFRPWLLSIARHASVDQLRAGKREIALDTEQAEALVSRDATPDDLAELHDLADTVQGCVTGLSQRDATAVAMVTQLGFTPAQVGSALGVSSGAAKVIVHRARRRLRSAAHARADGGPAAARLRRVPAAAHQPIPVRPAVTSTTASCASSRAGPSSCRPIAPAPPNARAPRARGDTCAQRPSTRSPPSRRVTARASGRALALQSTLKPTTSSSG